MNDTASALKKVVDYPTYDVAAALQSNFDKSASAIVATMIQVGYAEGDITIAFSNIGHFRKFSKRYLE